MQMNRTKSLYNIRYNNYYVYIASFFFNHKLPFDYLILISALSHPRWAWSVIKTVFLLYTRIMCAVYKMIRMPLKYVQENTGNRIEMRFFFFLDHSVYVS